MLSFWEHIKHKKLLESYESLILESRKKKRKLKRKAYHKYQTKDGYNIHVHMHKTKHGHAAVFHNKELGTVVKTVHWSHPSARPSRKQMEKIGRENKEEDLFENTINFLLEKGYENLDGDTAGKIAEHSAVIHAIGHKHSHYGTYGSKTHKKEIAEHERRIKELSKGKDPKQVATRIAHGREMANAALAHIRAKHGRHAYIKNVGHTSRSGDIGRFTSGRHNDGQENPADMTIEVGFTKSKKGK